MNDPISYSRRGGAWVGAIRGTWPFGKIEVSKGCVTVRVLGASRTLRSNEVLRVERLGFSTHPHYQPGLRLFFRGEHWEESVDFYTFSAVGEVCGALRSAGFNVVEPAKQI